MKIALLMAAGPVRNGWTNDAPKHLAPIAGKPLIRYTLDQLTNRGLHVIVVTKNEAVKAVVPHYFEPAKNYWWTETLLSTRELWEEWTAIINADTVYSNVVIDMLVEEPGPVVFIGDKVHNEILVFTEEMQSHVIDAAMVATAEAERRKAEKLTKRFKDNYSQGRHTMHFAFYRAIAGLPLVDLEAHVFAQAIHRLLPAGAYGHDFDKRRTYLKFLAKHAWARRAK